MAHAARQATRDIADTLLADARNYSFYSLLEHLYELHGDNLEAIDDGSPERERVRLVGYGGLGFPASDIAHAELLADEEDHYRIQTTFLSLQGPDSPLPGYYLDRLAYEYGQGVGIRPAFLDFFNHRLLTLLHRSWRKYRYYVRFRQEATDRFSRYIFSLIGLNDEELRGKTPLPWGRLLSFAGLIASRSRSTNIVSGIIAHCFDLDTVYIREFEQRYVDIPAHQRNSLGLQNGDIGENFVLGNRVNTRSSKFTIVIPKLTQARFREFLPSGINFERLSKLIEFLLRDPIAYDLELGLLREEVPPFNLNSHSGTHLGWTSFISNDGDTPLCNESVARIKVRT